MRWGVKAFPTMSEKIEESRKEEWEQLRKMSTSEFLFNHLESVSVQVKKLLFQGKLLCWYSGNDKEVICSIRNAMEQFRDRIHIIQIGRTIMSRVYFLNFFTKIIIINWKLHSVQPKPEDYRYGSFAFMDKGCEMVAAFRGEIFRSIFRPDRKDRVQRCIKVMMKDLGGGKAIRDQDPGVSDSLIKNTQTTSAAAS